MARRPGAHPAMLELAGWTAAVAAGGVAVVALLLPGYRHTVAACRVADARPVAGARPAALEGTARRAAVAAHRVAVVAWLDPRDDPVAAGRVARARRSEAVPSGFEHAAR